MGLNIHSPAATAQVIQSVFLSFCLSFSHGDFASEKSPFLQILKDAEAAANSAAIQLVSFKDAMEDEFAVCSLQLCIHQIGSNMDLLCGETRIHEI